MSSFVENIDRIQCAIACEAIYYEDPINYISQNCSEYNLIESIAMCNLKFSTRYMICSCSDKKLIVSFRGTYSIDDAITNLKLKGEQIEEIKNGYVHDGFYDRSKSIPIGYFKKKYELGYKLIFTGHSLGAAIAALLTLRILTRLNQEHVDLSRIVCVGFGPPLIGDESFANEVNSKFPNNFEFFLNKNDIVPKLLYSYGFIDYFLELDFNPKTSIQDMCVFSLDIVRNRILNSKSVPSYRPFGTYYLIKQANRQSLVLETCRNDENYRESLLSGYFMKTDDLVLNYFEESAKDHSIVSYRNNLISLMLPSSKKFENISLIRKFKDCCLSEKISNSHLNSESYKTNSKRSLLYIQLSNIKNLEFIFDCELELFDRNFYPNGKRIKMSKSSFQNNEESSTVKIGFKIKTNPNINLSTAYHSKIVIHSQFNTVTIPIQNKILFSHNFLITSKQLKIYELEIDMLYLHAISYFIINKSLNDTDEIDHRWEDIWLILKKISSKFSNKADKINSNIKEKDKICIKNKLMAVSNLSEDKLEFYLKDIKFIDLYNEFENDSWFESYNESPIEFMCRLYPTFYIMNKKLSSISQLINSNKVKHLLFSLNEKFSTWKSTYRNSQPPNQIELSELFNTDKRIRQNSKKFSVVSTNSQNQKINSSSNLEILFRIVNYNYRLRDLLVKDFIIGIVGNLSDEASTNELKCYNLDNNVILINMINCNYDKYRVLFKNMFDYVFVLVNKNEPREIDRGIIEKCTQDFDESFSLIFNEVIFDESRISIKNHLNRIKFFNACLEAFKSAKYEINNSSIIKKLSNHMDEIMNRSYGDKGLKFEDISADKLKRINFNLEDNSSNGKTTDSEQGARNFEVFICTQEISDEFKNYLKNVLPNIYFNLEELEEGLFRKIEKWTNKRCLSNTNLTYRVEYGVLDIKRIEDFFEINLSSDDVCFISTYNDDSNQKRTSSLLRNLLPCLFV